MTRTIFTIAFLAAIVGFAVPLALGLGDQKGRTLSEKFPLKEQFIELNGGASRLAGRRFVNTVYRTPRGMLLSELGGSTNGLRPSLEWTIEFADWLKGKGIAFLYLQAPPKIAMKGGMLPPPLVNGGNELADYFLGALRSRRIRTLDLRPMLSATEDDMMRHFYLTDHHWNNDAVFKAFGAVVPEIARAAGKDPAPAMPFLSPKSWRRKIWPKCFMGTKSRRTGRLFGGLDDMIVYTPRFKTNMSIEIPSRKVRRRGSFRRTVMWRADVIGDMKGNEFRADAYSLLYTGGIYGVVRHSNKEAPLKIRLLMVGDSYERPLEAFFSTVFSEVLVLDQRRFSRDETVLGFVEDFKPDVVLQLNQTALRSSICVAAAPSEAFAKKTGK